MTFSIRSAAVTGGMANQYLGYDTSCHDRRLARSRRHLRRVRRAVRAHRARVAVQRLITVLPQAGADHQCPAPLRIVSSSQPGDNSTTKRR